MATPYDDPEDEDFNLPAIDDGSDAEDGGDEVDVGQGGVGAAAPQQYAAQPQQYSTPVAPSAPRRPEFQGQLEAPDRTVRTAATKARLGMAMSDREMNRLAERQRLEQGPLPSREGLQAPDLETRRAALKVQAGRTPTAKELGRLVERQRLEGQQGAISQDYSVNSLLAGSRLDPRGTAREQQMEARRQEIERRRQEAAQLRAEKQTEALNKKVYNAEFLRRADETGVQYRMDPMTGLYREKLDAEGQPSFTATSWRPTIDPETGLPRMQRRGPTGQDEFKRPPLSLPANPEHTHLVADMGDGASVDFITFEDAAKSPDNNLAKMGMAGLSRRKQAVERREIQPFQDAKHMADLEYDTARTQVDALEGEIAQMSQAIGQQSQLGQQTEGGILGIGAQPTKEALAAQQQSAALTQQVAARSQQLEELKRRVSPGGDLHQRRMETNLQSQVKSAEFIRNRRADQEAERLEILKREGGDPETDPTLRAIRQGLSDSQRTLDLVYKQRDGYQKAMGAPTPVAAPAPEEEGDFVRGAKVSLGQTMPLLKGVVGLFGETAERVVGKGGIATGLKNYGLRGYQEGMQKLQPLQRENDDVTKAWAKAKDGDIGALIDWAQYGLGYAAGQMGESAAMALVGGLIGTAAAPGAGTVGGIAAGAVGKGAVRTAAANFIEKAVAKEAAKLVEAAALKQGTKLTAEQIAVAAAEEGARKLAAKSLARTVGQVAAIGANSFTQELGSIYPEAVEQAQKEGKTELSGGDLARVWATGIAAGGLESLSDKLGIDVALGKVRVPGVGGRLSRAATGALGGALVEGGTEVAQTGLERIGAGQSLVDDEAVRDYINSGALGAIGGTAVGGGAGLFQAPPKEDKPQTPPPTPPTAGPAKPGVTPSDAGPNPVGAPSKGTSEAETKADEDAMETLRTALLGSPKAPAAPAAEPTAPAAIAPTAAPVAPEAAAAPAVQEPLTPAPEAVAPEALTPEPPETTPTTVGETGEAGAPAPVTETPSTQPQNAIQEPSPEGVLQRQPEAIGEGGRGRGGVEQVEQGAEPAQAGEAQQPEAQGAAAVQEGEQARIGGEPVGGIERGAGESAGVEGEQTPAQKLAAVPEALRPEMMRALEQERLEANLSNKEKSTAWMARGIIRVNEDTLASGRFPNGEKLTTKDRKEAIRRIQEAKQFLREKGLPTQDFPRTPGAIDAEAAQLAKLARARSTQPAAQPEAVPASVAETPATAAPVAQAPDAETSTAQAPAEGGAEPEVVSSNKKIAESRRRIAQLREVQQRLEQVDPARANEVADKIAAEQNVLTQLLANKKTGKRFSVGTPADGQPDILNTIEDVVGRIRTVAPAGSERGGEYDGIAAALTGPAKALIGKESGSAPDQVYEELVAAGVKLTGVPDMMEKIQQAIEQRKKTAARVEKESYEQKVQIAAVTRTREGRHPRYFPVQAAEIDDVGVGGSFNVNGEKFEVIGMEEPDERTNLWRYVVKNGTTFMIPEGTMIYADKDSLNAEDYKRRAARGEPAELMSPQEPAEAELPATEPEPEAPVEQVEPEVEEPAAQPAPAPAPAPAPEVKAEPKPAPAPKAEPVQPPAAAPKPQPVAAAPKEFDIGNELVGFGKYSGVPIKELFQKDPGYATWLANNANTKRGIAVARFLKQTPEYKAAQAGQAEAIKQATSPETVKFLAKLKLGLEPRAGSMLAIKGNTYAFKELLKESKAGFDGTDWIASPTQVNEFVARLRGIPGVDSGQVSDLPANITNPEFRKLRADSERRPDRSGFEKPVSDYVGNETQSLLRRGEAVGMAKFVVDEQIEDVARINRAYQEGKKMFLLASEPGSGKTFVNGGAIRELRKSGAKKIVYVTLRQELISQIKNDLKDYDIGDVKFITYNDLTGTKTKPALAPEQADVLIWDEAHAIKNVTSKEEGEVVQRAAAAKEWIKDSKFTLFASATPFENPVESAYLEPTNIFAEPFGSAENFALAHGGKLREVRKEGRVVARYIQWIRGPQADADAKAAREFLRKEGVFTSRKIRLPEGMVDSRLVKMDVDDASSKLYNEFTLAAEAHDDELYGIPKAQIVNLQKRMLEAAKIQRGIQEAKAAIKRGRFPIIFVETKAERRIDIPDLIQRERDYERAVRSTMFDEPRPKRSDFGLPSHQVMEVYKTYYDNTGNGIIQIPSAEDVIKDAMGEGQVAIFTGSVTPKKAQENLDAWRAGTKPVLVATMAKGGTGLSLHDKTGKHPTTQININLPWSATQVVQVTQRSARYGLKSKAEMQWIFADNIPFDKVLASRVGGRMATMGALVQGERLAGSSEIENWDFTDLPFVDVKEQTKQALTDLSTEPTGTKLEDAKATLAEWRKSNPQAPQIDVVYEPDWTVNGLGVRGQYVNGRLTLNAAYSTDIAGDAMHEWAHDTLASQRGKVALATFATREIPQNEMSDLAKKYPKQAAESVADHRLRLVEEWVAKNAEKQPGIFQRIVEAVRNWLASRGLAKLSNAEAARAMLRALRGEQAATTSERYALTDESKVPESLQKRGLPADTIEYEVRNQEERWSNAEATVAREGVENAKRMVMDRKLPMDDRVAIAGVLLQKAKLDGVETNRLARLLQGNVSTEAGQAVAMHAKIYEKLGPMGMVVEHTKRIQEEQQDKLGNKFPADAAQQVSNGLNQAGVEASEGLRGFAEGREPQGPNAKAIADAVKRNVGILGLLRQAAAERGIKWGELFTSLPENQAARKEELFRRVKENERLKDLTPKQQQQVAEKLEAAWTDLRNNIFRAEFSRLVELPTVKKEDVEKVKSITADLIKYHNLGLLDNAAFLDALADKYGIENMNGAVAQKLRELADQIQKESSPAKKAQLTLDMMREYQKAKGVRKVDYFQSLMYANILSGYTTLTGGMVVPNFLNSLWQLSTMALAKPKQAKTLLRGYASGFSEGLEQFKSIIATSHGGQDPAAMAAETRGDALEMLAMGDAFPKLKSKFPMAYKGLQTHAKALRYVGRLVRAIDALAYYPAKEAQTWAATETLLASKLTGAALHNKVQEVLGVRPGDFAKFRTQAETEGYTGYDLSRRISDLLEEHRKGTNVGALALERGKRFGLGTTLSGEPEGWAGVVYSHVSDMVNKVTPGGVPVLKPFFMFLRVPTNFYNLAMSATPWGAFRAYKGEVVTTQRKQGKFVSRQLSEDERHQLFMQAAIGTALMGYLAARAMSAKPGDDDDLTATGPRSPSARAQWQANGGIPYSIKLPGTDTRVSYQQWPIAVPLAIAGHVADSLRYDDTPDTTTLKRITDSLIRFPSVIFGAPVLNGLSQLADLTNAYRPSTKKAEMFIKNMGTSTVMPRLLTQIDQTFRDDVVRDGDAIRYDSLGEPVRYTPYGRMISSSNKTPLREWLNRQQIIVPVPQRDIKIDGRPHKLTDEEFSELERLAGTRTRVLLEAQLPILRSLPKDQAEKRVKSIANEQLESVRSMMKATRMIAPNRLPMPTAAR